MQGDVDPVAVAGVGLQPPVHRGGVEQDVLDEQVVVCCRGLMGEGDRVQSGGSVSSEWWAHVDASALLHPTEPVLGGWRTLTDGEL